MDSLSFVLTILGIAATIMLSDPIVRLIRLAFQEMLRHSWSAKLYRGGHLQNVRHFGFEKWAVRSSIDESGSITLSFDGRLINLGNDLLRTFFVPFFSDAQHMSKTDIQPWATYRKKPLPIELDFLDERRSQGRIAIKHVPPLRPGERRSFQWGLTLPKAFSAGDEYYDWDVEVPYYDLEGSMKFAPNWKVLYAHWEVQKQGHYPPPEFSDSEIRWRIILPEPGTRFHLRFGLAAIEPASA